jgi:hypothetical protein
MASRRVASRAKRTQTAGGGPRRGRPRPIRTRLPEQLSNSGPACVRTSPAGSSGSSPWWRTPRAEVVASIRLCLLMDQGVVDEPGRLRPPTRLSRAPSVEDAHARDYEANRQTTATALCAPAKMCLDERKPRSEAPGRERGARDRSDHGGVWANHGRDVRGEQRDRTRGRLAFGIASPSIATMGRGQCSVLQSPGGTPSRRASSQRAHKYGCRDC